MEAVIDELNKPQAVVRPEVAVDAVSRLLHLEPLLEELEEEFK